MTSMEQRQRDYNDRLQQQPPAAPRALPAVTPELGREIARLIAEVVEIDSLVSAPINAMHYPETAARREAVTARLHAIGIHI